MNEVLKTIYERRALRKYSARPVFRSDIEQIIDAGRMAPSAINKQPWKFYVLTSKEDIQAFSNEISWAATKEMSHLKQNKDEALKNGAGIFKYTHQVDFYKIEDIVFHEAPVVIFISAPKDNKWATIDIGMCTQNMMLAAKSMGLDTCPVGMGKYVEQTLIYSRLPIPKEEQIVLALTLGYGDEEPKMHERARNNVFYL